jgi:predicted branched-subunit amino acid permease
VIAAKVLAVVSAVLLVVAFALAVLLPPLTTLSLALSMLDHSWLVAAQDAIRNNVSEWAWLHLAVPLLVRPVWLMPAALGLVIGGAALTASRGSGAPRSHRRRS